MHGQRNTRIRLLQGITTNILMLGLVSLLTDVSSQMVFPLIPLFLTTVLGASAYTVGITEGAAATTAALLKVISGYWSDKIEKRKPFILLGYSLSTIMKPLFAFAHTWPVVLIARVLERIGKGVRTAPRDALLAESCDSAIRGKAYGFHRAMDGIGSIAGALIAFVLLPAIGYRNIFLLAFFPGIAAASVIILIREKTTAPEKVRIPAPIRISLKDLPTNLKLFILVSSLFALGHLSYAFLLLRANNIGLTDNVAILLYVIFYIAYTLCATPLGTLSDKIGRKPVLMMGYAVFMVSCLGLIFASSFYSILLTFILYGVFYAMIDGTQRAFVVDLAPEGSRATALGVFHTAVGLVALPGGYLAGVLWDKVSPGATFGYGIALAAVAIVLFTTVKGVKKTESCS